MIHSSAIIEHGASISSNVKIGPFCMIGPEVTLGNNVELKSHVVITGKVSVGDNTTIFPFASIGHIPQDLKYKGEPSEVIIGSNNIIREYVTVQPGTIGGGMVTKIGNNCLFMVGVHIAHDCQIGDNVILANCVTLGGHVKIHDYVVIGGLSAVLQYVRIGQHAMIGGMSAIEKDIIPFGLAKNERATLDGLNLVGMNRRGFDKQQSLDSIKAIDKLFTEESNFMQRLEEVRLQYSNNPIVAQIIAFIKKDHTRALCQPKK